MFSENDKKLYNSFFFLLEQDTFLQTSDSLFHWSEEYDLHRNFNQCCKVTYT